MLKETSDLLKQFYQLDDEVFKLSEEVMEDIKEQFDEIKEIREFNQYKVLKLCKKLTYQTTTQLDNRIRIQ